MINEINYLKQFDKLLFLIISLLSLTVFFDYFDLELSVFYFQSYLVLYFLKSRVAQRQIVKHLDVFVFTLFLLTSSFFVQKKLVYNILVIVFSLYPLVRITMSLADFKKIKTNFYALEFNYILISLYVLLIILCVKVTEIFTYVINFDNSDFHGLIHVILFLFYGTLSLITYYFSSLHLANLSKEYFFKENFCSAFLKTINQSELSELANEILHLFIIDKVFLDSSFNLDALATMLDKPKNQISTVINSELNESFYSLLAKYRVEYAKKLLETNRHLLLDGVMLQSGFNSRSTFIKYFKEFVGESPSAYRKTFEYNL